MKQANQETKFENKSDLIKLLFVINTAGRGKKILLDIPEVDKIAQNKTYYTKLNARFNSGVDDNYFSDFSLKMNKEESIKNDNQNNNDILTEIFSLNKYSTKNQHILDIQIGDYRCISFPLRLENSKYMSNKKVNDVSEDENQDQTGDVEDSATKLSEDENQRIRLKMFNIVLVFHKSSLLLRKHLENVYNVLESFSHHLSFEEYRTNHLRTNIQAIIKRKKDMQKLGLDENNAKSDETILEKTLKKFYKELTKFSVLKVVINHWFEFKASLTLSPYNYEIKPYHTLIITNNKNMQDWIHKNHDVNPLLQIFVKVCTPFKNFTEISLDHKIPLDFIIAISKQMHAWNLGKIIKKIHNYSHFTVSEEYVYNAKREQDFHETFNGSCLYDTINTFISPDHIDKIYSEKFSDITNDKFLKILHWLIENEFVVQCSKIVVNKLPMRRKYNPELELLNKSHFLFKKNEKLDCYMNDVDSYIGYKESKENDSTLYVEDIVKMIHERSPSDAEILKNIFYFLSTDFEFEEIAYLSGYNMSKLYKFFNEYKWLFSSFITQNDNTD